MQTKLVKYQLSCCNLSSKIQIKNVEIIIFSQQRLYSMLRGPAGSPSLIKTQRWWYEPSLALEGRELVLCGGGWLQLVSLRSLAPCLWLRSRLRQPWCWGLRAKEQHSAQQQTPYWSNYSGRRKTEIFSCHLLVRSGRSSKRCGWLGTSKAPFINSLFSKENKNPTVRL